VPVAGWLVRHDVGSAAGTLHETAVDNARGRLLTLAAGLVAAGALIFTFLNFNLLRRNSQQADQWQQQANQWQQRSHELTEQGAARLMPGNRALAVRGKAQSAESPQAVAALEVQYGVQTPTGVWGQYTQYWDHLLHGNLGTSLNAHPAPRRRCLPPPGT
jgi:hypothetical protein